EAMPDELALRGEDLEAQADRLAHQIRLGETELDALRAVAARNRDAQRFAVAEQVVGGIFESEEAAREARDAAVELDLLAAFLLDLEVDVHGLIPVVGAGDRVLILDLVEQPQLVQTDEREVPVAFVISVAFVHEHLAAQDDVAGI